jgi:hypothetical protein
LTYKIAVIGAANHHEVIQRSLEGLNVSFYPTMDQFLREFGSGLEFPLIVIGEKGLLFRKPFKQFKEDNPDLVRSLVINNRPLKLEEADDYLLKPLNGAHLRRRVETHLSALKKVSEQIKAHVLGEVFDTAFASAPIGITVSVSLNSTLTMRPRGSTTLTPNIWRLWDATVVKCRHSTGPNLPTPMISKRSWSILNASSRGRLRATRWRSASLNLTAQLCGST